MNFAAPAGPVTPADSKHLHLQVLPKAAPPERKCLARGKWTPALKKRERKGAAFPPRSTRPASLPPSRPRRRASGCGPGARGPRYLASGSGSDSDSDSAAVSSSSPPDSSSVSSLRVTSSSASEPRALSAAWLLSLLAIAPLPGRSWSRNRPRSAWCSPSDGASGPARPCPVLAGRLGFPPGGGRAPRL